MLLADTDNVPTHEDKTVLPAGVMKAAGVMDHDTAAFLPSIRSKPAAGRRKPVGVRG